MKLFRHNVGVELQELQQTLAEENSALAAKAEQHNRQVELLQSKVTALEEKLLQVRITQIVFLRLAGCALPELQHYLNLR